jgi:anti-sigma regulatory factor (Ser/Thr protein kinase)
VVDDSVAERPDRVPPTGPGPRERALMRPRSLVVFASAVVLVMVVLVGLAVMATAAFPVLLVLGATVLTLVAGVGSRLRRLPVRRGRRASARAGVGRDDARGTDGAPGLRWTTGWETDPPPEAVPHTRERVSVVLAEWGLTGESVEPTLLVVTELLSNAIDHAHGPVRLSVELADEAVHVEVRDATPDPPRLQPPDPTRARGRGVHLVDALSLRWGWREDLPGKVVWAHVPTGWPA